MLAKAVREQRFGGRQQRYEKTKRESKPKSSGMVANGKSKTTVIDHYAKCMEKTGAGEYGVHRYAMSALLRVLDDNLLVFSKMALKMLTSTVHNLQDRDLLLEQNKMLFINYVLGRYLTCHKLSEQVSWLAVGEARDPTLKILEFLDVEDLLSTRLRLFGQDTVMQKVYLGFAEDINGVNWTPAVKEEIMEVLVYYVGNLKLSHGKTVEQLLEINVKKFGMATGREISSGDLKGICLSLEAMAKLLDCSGLTSLLLSTYSVRNSPYTYSLPLSYTNEEDQWLCEKRHKMFSAMMSIPQGPEIIQASMNFFFDGIPINPAMLIRTYHMVGQRLWRMYLSLPEFKALPSQAQTKAVTAAHKMMFTLVTARIDGCAVGEQAAHIFAPDEMGKQEVAKLGSIKITIRYVMPGLPPEWEAYRDRVHEVMSADGGTMTYFALIVLVLFGSSAAINGHSATSGQLRAFQSLKLWFDLCLSRKFGPAYEGDIYRAFRDVRTLCDMMPNF